MDKTKGKGLSERCEITLHNLVREVQVKHEQQLYRFSKGILSNRFFRNSGIQPQGCTFGSDSTDLGQHSSDFLVLSQGSARDTLPDFIWLPHFHKQCVESRARRTLHMKPMN
jgi:hypothetical protein